MSEVEPRSGGQAVMRLALRGLALLSALSVIYTILFVVRFGTQGLKALAMTGALGVTTIIGWLITLIVGPYAAVQLFRLRNRGRIAAAILFGTMSAYYILGGLFFRDPGDPWLPLVITGALTGACTALLLIPHAKRAVSSGAAGFSPPNN